MPLSMSIDQKRITAKQVKSVIAHEFGHAVCGYLFDNIYFPSSLDFNSDNGYIAFCEFDELHRKFKPNFKHESNLGGLFGELINTKRFNCWGSSADIESFVLANLKAVTAEQHQHPLLDELDNWLWVDEDKLSFRHATKTRVDRRSVFMELDDMAYRLPQLHKKFKLFEESIYPDRFKEVIEEIYRLLDKKNKYIKKEDLITCIKYVIGK